MGEPPLWGLPLEIQQMVKRKSSRDPMSRFSSKLHNLLKYAGDDANLQEFIGAGWVSSDRFRLNKKRLIEVMEIKLNTLNVNLKDLKFRQLAYDQQGWTIWERQGFTRSSTLDDLADVRGEKVIQPEALPEILADDSQMSKLSGIHDIVLGITDASAVILFKRFVMSIWEELIPSNGSKFTAAPDDFFGAAAERFRASHQKLENSLVILKTVFVSFDPNQFSILDFAKFMAKFGPEETLMQKIGSLLKASNDNNNWLKIGRDQGNTDPKEGMIGYFDENEHNCFVLNWGKGKCERVYNMVDVPFGGAFLVDSGGRKCLSWQEYFEYCNC
jgi:hypothetical protein